MSDVECSVSLTILGFSSDLASALAAFADPALLAARVVAVHRGGVVLAGGVAGLATLRRTAGPVVVGDWVAARRLGDRTVVEHVLPRRGVIARKAIGRSSAAQPIAANVDRLIVLTAPDADFSPRRMERYLALAWDGGAVPVLVLAKTDLVDDTEPFIRALSAIASGVEVVQLSARTGHGVDVLAAELTAGMTGALVGSSGVGKSTLVNALLGVERQAVTVTRAGDAKGRHTTTARELFVLPGGGLLIDTPGMRELGLTGGPEGLDAAFADVSDLAIGCRFGNCRHAGEPGCAVAAATASGALAADRLEAFRALAAELAYEERRQARADRKHVRAINRAMRARSRSETELPDD